MAVTLALGLLIGVALGMLGGGGSILTVPVFVYIAGLDPKVAIATSLPVVGITSLVGAAGHWRAGHLVVRTALTFGAITMVGGFAGARLAPLLTGEMQLILLAVVMVAAAASMWRRSPVPAGDVAAEPPPIPPLAQLVPLGLAVGVLTGLVGIGGGFLVVPALVLLARVPMRAAVGTSLLVIAMNAAAGALGYIGQVPFDGTLLWQFTLFAIVGIVIGTKLSSRVPQATLKRAFAVLLFVVGSLVLYQNRVALGVSPSVADAGTTSGP